MGRMLMVFPARAGMIPQTSPPTMGAESIPRESGDDPTFSIIGTTIGSYSPRERG